MSYLPRETNMDPPHEDVARWHNQPTGLKQVVGRGGYGSQDGMLTGTVTKLGHQKIPHYPACRHTFIHGWIYTLLLGNTSKGTLHSDFPVIES